MMNWRKVVCIMAAGMLCTGLVLAGDTGTTNPTRGHSTNAVAPNPAINMANNLVAIPGHAPTDARDCTGWMPFDNSAWQGYYINTTPDVNMFMCVYLGCGQASFNMSCYQFRVANSNTIDETFTAGWYTGPNDDPWADCGNMTLIPGTEFSFTVIAGQQPLLQADLSPAVTIPEAGHTMAYFGIKQNGSGGPILGGPVFGDSCNMWCDAGVPGWYWFGGTPYAAWWVQAFSADAPLTGACCMGDCKGTLSQADCVATYPGAVWFCGESCPDYICPPPPLNDVCETATDVGVLVDGVPVTINGSNQFATPEGTCLTLTDPPAVWFKFQVAEPMDVFIDSTGTSPDFTWIYNVIAPDCPCTMFEGFDSYWTWWPFTIKFYRVTPGQDWYYPLLSDPGQQRPNYQLTFLATKCDVVCTDTEGEICGDDMNGGCNMVTPAFTPIACDEVVCGTVWATDGERDTDWYEFVATAYTEITWTVTSEVPVNVIILDPSGGCPVAYPLASAHAYDCVPAVATACVPPGTYYLFVGSDFAPWPCDVQYTATLTCVTPCTRTAYPPAASDNCYVTNNGSEYISEVQIGTIDNITTSDTGCYSDYTSISTDVAIGASYVITVTNGNGYTTDSAGVFIDWNRDFYFEYSEWTFLSPLYSVGPYTGTIVVPNVALGPAVMRVRIMCWNLLPAPGGQSVWGEVEDYTLNVINPQLRGDVDCDGSVNAFDIDPFVRCVVNGTPTPPCTDCLMADIDCDGSVNAFDIDPFVQCVINGTCGPCP